MYLRLSTLKALISRREIHERTVEGLTPSMVATSLLVKPGTSGFGVCMNQESRIYAKL
jgi:hypothetical protein